MALRTKPKPEDLLSGFAPQMESPPVPSPLRIPSEVSREAKKNIFLQTTAYEEARVESLIQKTDANREQQPEERKGSFVANLATNDDALYSNRIKPSLRRRLALSSSELLALGGAAALQTHGIETGMGHALDAAILSLFGVAALLSCVDIGMASSQLRMEYSKVKESHAYQLAITSLFQVAICVIGPVLALSSMLFFDFTTSFWSWLDIGLLALLLLMSGLKMYSDLKLYKQQQNFLLGKQLRLSHNLTEKQLASLLKKVSTNEAPNMTQPHEGDDTLASVSNDLLKQLVERNKKYQGHQQVRLSSHDSLNSYMKLASDQASVHPRGGEQISDPNTSLPVSMRSQARQKPAAIKKAPVDIFNQSNLSITETAPPLGTDQIRKSSCAQPITKTEDLMAFDQSGGSSYHDHIQEPSAQGSSEDHLQRITEEASSLSKKDSLGSRRHETYTREEFYRCLNAAKLREEKIRAESQA